MDGFEVEGKLAFHFPGKTLANWDAYEAWYIDPVDNSRRAIEAVYVIPPGVKPTAETLHKYLAWRLNSTTPTVDPIDTSIIVQFAFNQTTNDLTWNVFASDGKTSLNNAAKNFTLSIRTSDGTTVYNEKHTFETRTFSMTSYDDGDYNARIDVFGKIDGESLWKPWDGYDFTKAAVVVDFLLDDSNWIMVEYVAPKTFQPADVTFWTSNSSLAVNGGLCFIFNSQGFCIYKSDGGGQGSVWEPPVETKVNGTTCYKEIHNIQDQITFTEGETYYILAFANRWGSGLHNIGYYDEAGTSGYKSFTSLDPNNITVGNIPEGATYIGEIKTEAELQAMLNGQQTVGDYFYYTGPTVKFINSGNTFAKGYYSINTEGSFRGDFRAQSEKDQSFDFRTQISDPQKGDIALVYFTHQVGQGAYYSIYWTFDGALAWSNPWNGLAYGDNGPLPALDGFNADVFNAEVKTDRNYKFEVN